MTASADRGANGSSSTDGAVATEPLRARLRVEPDERAGCAVLAAGERGDDVVRTACQATDPDADACRVAVTVESGDERQREFVSGTTDEYCVCLAFDDVECAAEIEGFRGSTLAVTVTVPHREALRDLVAALRAREATVQLEQVLPLDVGDARRELRIDAHAVTGKQREAIRVAVDLGYYERPRGADLDDVADALGVSRSAVSQRLNAAEATLIDGFVDATDLSKVGTVHAGADGGAHTDDPSEPATTHSD
jgi:predicted DNA binding protein